MSKYTAVVALLVVILSGTNACQDYNWRDMGSLVSLGIKRGHTLSFYWDQGTPTAIVQIDYPGICVNGTISGTIPWNDSAIIPTINSDLTVVAAGAAGFTFNAYGHYVLSSPVPGECDTHWLLVTVS